MSDALFWLLAVLLVSASAGVVLSKSLYRAAYSLAATLATTAFFYLLLTSPLLAAVQIILYTGGVLTLVVYALVITGSPQGYAPWRRPFPAMGIAIVVFVVLASYARALGGAPAAGGLESGKALGGLLFGTYLVPFELLSVLLLAALLGALTIARKEGPS